MSHVPPHHLRFEGVGKTFPGVQALADITFGVRAASVHALLGENGAGKSTLLKALSGAHRPSTGHIRLGDSPRAFSSTAEAIAAGIAVIYQELHLAPEMSVEENLFLGRLPSRLGILNRRRLRAAAIEQLRRIGEEIDPAMKVGRLSIGQRQMIEIAKALSRGARVIAFDEPTSSLSSREIDRLFEIIRQLQREGRVILYVTHRMEEVFAVCDSATVLRDGRHVCTWESLSGVTHDLIVKAMVGRDIADVFRYAPRARGTAALQVQDLTGPGITGPTSFEAASGEIVGLFGLVGSGRTELLKLVYGAVRKTGGRVRICGREVAIRAPADAIAAGLLFSPEDRKKEGIIPVRSVMENLNLSARRTHSFAGFLINDAWERRNTASFIERLSIRTPSPRQAIMHLSGGNQQKVILARWLSEKLNVILLDEPTRGIDVGAKSEIYSIIYELAAGGAAVVVVSSDLPEVLGICDRVLVMRQGRIVGSLERAQATSEAVIRLALPLSS